MATSVALERVGIGTWHDRLFVALAIAHGALLLAAPSLPLVALGLWWNANTIAHNLVHRPLFHAPGANRVFSAYLSLLLGFPQTLWRRRHLAHHAAAPAGGGSMAGMAFEAGLVLALWAALGALAPAFFRWTYLPGFLSGLGLCWLHGRYEHASGTTSNYGRLYNVLFFNDGYHVEHHRHPGAHWSELPLLARPAARASRWPAVLRWLDALSLEGLERSVLRSPRLQRFVLSRHARAFRRLLPELPAVSKREDRGGRLFSRTALILAKLLPEARLSIVDRSPSNLATARPFLDGPVELVNTLYTPPAVEDADLLVIPLSYGRERAVIYRHPPARAVLVHDWIWRRRG